MPPKRRKKTTPVPNPPQTPIAFDSAGKPLPPAFDKQAPTLETLPDEIKIKIFRNLLVSDTPIWPCSDGKGVAAGFRDYLIISKSFYDIAAPILYGENRCAFQVAGDFTTFCRRAKPYRSMIKSLLFGDLYTISPRSIAVNATRVKQLRAFSALESISLLEGQVWWPDGVANEEARNRAEAFKRTNDVNLELLHQVRPELRLTMSLEFSTLAAYRGQPPWVQPVDLAPHVAEWSLFWDPARKTRDATLISIEELL